MTESKVTITKGSNFFRINNFTEEVKKLAYEFTRRFIRIDYLSTPSIATSTMPMTVFASATKRRDEFRFHINSLDEWLALLNNCGIKEPYITTNELEHVKSAHINIKIKKGWSPRDYQEDIIKYLISDNNPITDNKFVGMQTGRGKGFCAISAICTIDQRAIFIIRPGYIQKWADEFVEKTNIKMQDIMAVRGGKELKAFLQLCEMNALDTNKIVLISNKTYQIWLKAYEEFGADSRDLGYAIMPEELFVKANAGVRVIDEVHQDFHLCFKTDLYTNTNKCISMSASLMDNNPITSRMYEIAYPRRSRGPEVEFRKYIDIYAVSYFLEDGRNYRTEEWGSSTYSHIAYEKSILRNKYFYRSYAEMIYKLVEKGYASRRKEGQKAIVFASSIAMCDALTEFLSKKYPHLSVKRFCENDPLENLLDADIRVSNVIKAGTAHDIKGLITTILTINISSLQSNLQVFGRLREIPGEDTEFYYLICQSIPKHKAYHRQKIELLKPLGRNYKEILYPTKI